MLATLALCAALFDTCIRTEPALPAAGAPFDIIYEGDWPATNVPRHIVSARVEGRDVRIVLGTGARAGDPVGTSRARFSTRIPAAAFAPDGLPHGTYRVHVEVDSHIPVPQGVFFARKFTLIGVHAPRVVPRSGVWRALEADDVPRNADGSRRDSGIRLIVSVHDDLARLVLVGFHNSYIGGVFAVPVATWAEGTLPLGNAHIAGSLQTGQHGRLFDGLRRGDYPGEVRTRELAVEWLDARRGTLYLWHPNAPLEPVTALPLVLEEAPLSAASLVGEWLATAARSDTVVAASFVRFELVEASATRWAYLDERSTTRMECTPAPSRARCVLNGTGRIRRADVLCDATACAGAPDRGVSVELVRRAAVTDR